MKINYNISAIIANNALNNNDAKLTASSGRLSSGYKINEAKDNPSGIAIGKRMRAQIRALEQSDDNANDAISVVETADGALTEVHAILQRMNELAVKAGTGTATDSDRENIDAEMQQLKKEIERIATDTDFNGQALLDGTFDRRSYSSVDGLSVVGTSDDLPAGVYTVSVTTVLNTAGDLEISAASISTTTAIGADGLISGANALMDNNKVSITDSSGMQLTLRADQDKLSAGTYNATIEVTDIGAMRVQIGANEGQVMEIRIPAVSLFNMGVDKSNTLTQENAQKAINQIAEGISYISSVRSRLGAYQNRLEHLTSSLDITQEEMTSAYSRIMDVDMAAEMTQYTNLQVLVQAGTSVLAQANERPQEALQLLQ